LAEETISALTQVRRLGLEMLQFIDIVTQSYLLGIWSKQQTLRKLKYDDDG
jgi:hypothetical protein